MFFDDKPLQRVGSLGELGPGKFFFDYGAQKIYIGDNPTGHRGRGSGRDARVHGLADDPTNVTIRGLVIEKFANEAGSGRDQRERWLGDREQRGAPQSRDRDPGRRVIRNNNVHHNGQLGLSLYGETDVLVEGNEIAFNNYAGYGTSWEAGGGKFMRTTGLTVREQLRPRQPRHRHRQRQRQHQHVYEYNRIEDNAGTGILIETSYATVIRNNTIRRNGFAFTGGLAGAGIYLNTSQDVEIYGNTIDRNLQGIGIFTTNRGSGPYGTYVTKNNYVHDNTLILRRRRHGITSYAIADYTSNNNRFQNNHYILCGTACFAVSNGAGAYSYTNAQAGSPPATTRPAPSPTAASGQPRQSRFSTRAFGADSDAPCRSTMQLAGPWLAARVRWYPRRQPPQRRAHVRRRIRGQEPVRPPAPRRAPAPSQVLCDGRPARARPGSARAAGGRPRRPRAADLEQVREVRRAGLDLAAQRWRHPSLVRLAADEARGELERPKQTLDQLGEPVTALGHRQGKLRMPSRPVVVSYHAVSDTWPSALAIRTNVLRERLGRLAHAGFVDMTISEAERRRRDGTLPPRSFAVTFDDGYRSTLEAKPVLDELGFPATVFVVSDFIGLEAPMAWPGIRGGVAATTRTSCVRSSRRISSDLSRRGGRSDRAPPRTRC